MILEAFHIKEYFHDRGTTKLYKRHKNTDLKSGCSSRVVFKLVRLNCFHNPRLNRHHREKAYRASSESFHDLITVDRLKTLVNWTNPRQPECHWNRKNLKISSYLAFAFASRLGSRDSRKIERRRRRRRGKNGKPTAKWIARFRKRASPRTRGSPTFRTKRIIAQKLRVHIIERGNVSITGQELFNQTSRVSSLPSFLSSNIQLLDSTILFQWYRKRDKKNTRIPDHVELHFHPFRRSREKERERGFFSIVEERYKWQHRAYSCEVEFRKCYVRCKIHVYRTPISWSTCQTVYAYIYPSSAKYEARTASQCLDSGRELEESFVLKEILDIIRYFKLTAIYNKLSNLLIKSFKHSFSKNLE